jgi:hypothetical protein
MAKAAASTPKRGKATTKTATTATTTATTKTAATASNAKPRSRTPKRTAEAESAAQTPPTSDQTLAQLATRLDAFEEKITTNLSCLQTDLQVVKDLLHAVQQVQHTQRAQDAQFAELTEGVQYIQQAQQTQLAELARHEQAGGTSQAKHTQTNGEEPSETFLPIVADLIRQNLTEHLSPLTTTLRRLEERVGFMSNRLKLGPGGQGGSGGQDRQKPWRRDQRDQRDQQPHHFRSRGQGQGRQGPGQGQGPVWSPPSAASVQGHFAPRRFPSNGGELQVGDDDE